MILKQKHITEIHHITVRCTLVIRLICLKNTEMRFDETERTCSVRSPADETCMCIHSARMIP